MPDERTQASTGRIPLLDALRGVAVLAVLVNHLFGRPSGGYLGVDLFFVLSGYLITGLLQRSHGEPRRLRNFWAARARRLIPALTVTLLLALFVVARAGGGNSSLYRDDVRWSAGFLSNWWFAHTARGYQGLTQISSSPVGHLWSLAIEEQFYVLWPLILGVLLVWRFKRANAFVIASAVAASYVVFAVTGAGSGAGYYSTWGRSFELLIGALVHFVGTCRTLKANLARVLRILGGTGLAWAFLSTSILYRSQLGSTIVVLATTCFLFSLRSDAPSRLLDNAVLRWVGARSYGLYLLHLPIYMAFTSELGRGNTASFAALVATLVVATVMYHGLELPIRTSARLKSSPVLSLGLGASLLSVVMVASLVGPLAGGSRSNVEGPTGIVTATTTGTGFDGIECDLSSPLCETPWLIEDGGNFWRCAGEDTDDQFGDTCVVYQPAEPTLTIALFGDSVPKSMAPGLVQEAIAKRWKIIVSTISSCPWYSSSTVVTGPDDIHRYCKENQAARLEFLHDNRPDIVIVSQTANEFREPLSATAPQQAAATLRALEDDGAKVLLVLPPRSLQDPDCVKNARAGDNCHPWYDKPVDDSRRAALVALYQSLSDAPGRTLFDTESATCFPDVARCEPIHDGLLTRSDLVHLPLWLSLQFGHLLAQQIEASAATK